MSENLEKMKDHSKFLYPHPILNFIPVHKLQFKIGFSRFKDKSKKWREKRFKYLTNIYSTVLGKHK